MHSNKKFVVYTGWKMGMLYSSDVYGAFSGYYGTKKMIYSIVVKVGLCVVLMWT